ncbi:MAG: hypothetical protein ACREIT_03855 [Tepidisphaeraceae bacterium]
MRRSGLCTMITLLALTISAIAQTRPATFPTEPLTADELDTVYRAELGPRHTPAIAEKLHGLHPLIEQYFAADSQQSRDELVAQIESADVAPEIIGRVVRVRLDWPKPAAGVYWVDEKFGRHTVRYLLGIPPAYDRTRAWPLVVALPGSEAFVAQAALSPEQLREEHARRVEAELRRRPDAIVLMPLLDPQDALGLSLRATNAVIQPLLHATGRVNVDPRRVYLIGHGSGGYAAWNIALHYPTCFAAFAPLAAGADADWQRLRLMNLRNVLPVVWADADDAVVKPDQSRQLVAALRRMKLDVDFDQTSGLGHVPSKDVVERVDKKMRARSRSLYPQQVSLQSNRRETMFNRVDWVQVYQPINPGADRRLLIRHSPAPMIVSENAFKIDAAITKPNTIEAMCDNIASMRFYLNDQMVDLSKPVTLIVNRRTRFEGIVEPSVAELLKDQLILGRGWRYFTAVIDVDLTERPATTKATTVPAGG